MGANCTNVSMDCFWERHAVNAPILWLWNYFSKPHFQNRWCINGLRMDDAQLFELYRASADEEETRRGNKEI